MRVFSVFMHILRKLFHYSKTSKTPFLRVLQLQIQKIVLNINKININVNKDILHFIIKAVFLLHRLEIIFVDYQIIMEIFKN